MILLQRGQFKNIDSGVSNERNPDEKEIHLTNNAIQKNMSNYEKFKRATRSYSGSSGLS
jgi:hypothetical protein